MTERTAVVLDASSLSGVSARSGIGTFTRNLLSALAARPDLALTALSDPITPLPAGVDRLAAPRWSTRARAQVIEHSIRMPVELWRHRPRGAVFHNPGFHAPAGVTGPWVQTLLDVIPLVYDAPDQKALRARWKRFGPRYARADGVVAISRHAADEGIRLLGIDPAKVHVAHCGVDEAFTPVGPVADEGPPYLLMVGEYSRRKGFEEGFAVAGALADAGYPHQLLVAGQVHPWGAAELDALHARAHHPERIHRLGFVEDLASLYRGASCFLMPSRYEGFGLPCLEAMACGAPVVAFDNSSLGEVIGDGGVLVPDGDVVAMTSAVRRVLDSPAAASDLSSAGVQRALAFTWSSCAEVHASVYQHVARA